MKAFNCGCSDTKKTHKAVMGDDKKINVVAVPTIPPPLRLWVINEDDETGVPEQPDNTHIIHECKKIRVFQKHQSLKRYFQKM